MNDDNQCYRCHVRTKFLETFKTCVTCSKRYCSQCWIEFHRSDHRTRKKFCQTCLESMIKKSERKFSSNDDDFQLALALSLSEKETHFEDKIDQEELLLKQINEAIERFFNRAKSNYQRHRDITADTALLSAFISLQTSANDLDHLRDRLHEKRQNYENLQEKLTSLRDAREVLNLLRHEYQQKKHHEREQRRWIMMQKVADLRMFKHNQLADYQENYLQQLNKKTKYSSV